MTSEEFLNYIQLHPYRVNVLYNNIAPPYVIEAISIPTLNPNARQVTGQGDFFSNNGEYSYNTGTPLYSAGDYSSTGQEDISSILARVQQIAIPLPSGGKQTLEILSRQLITSNIGTSYLFDVKDVTVPRILPTTLAASTIQLLPAINDAIFYDSPYNILQGFVDGGRKSEYIMQSDRYKVGTLANPTYTGPLNIDALLTGSAPKAAVQDSNYSNAGWIRGRYEGSTTTRSDFKTDPATAGSLFVGAEFSAGTLASQIKYLQTNTQIIFKELFFAGTGDTPGFTLVNQGYLLTGSGTSATIDDTVTSILIIPPAYGYQNTGEAVQAPQAGSLIQIDNEIMKINTVGVIDIGWLRYTLTVTRGWNSVPAAHNSSNYGGAVVKNVKQVQIYNISGNKLTGVPKGQVLIKETGALVRMDQLGFIVSSSQL
jgi:hypothetical protein